MCTSERAAEAFNTFKEWATHKSIFVKVWYGSLSKSRWITGRAAFTAGAHSSAAFTVAELRRRVLSTANFGQCACAACCRAHWRSQRRPDAISNVSCDPLVTGSLQISPEVHRRVKLAVAQKKARDAFWLLTEQAHATGDFKLASKDAKWRE